MFTDKETRDRAEFFIKNGALIVSALWVLLTGSAYLDRQSKSLDLRNRMLGIESNPTADTQLSATFTNRPWVGNPSLCTVTGQYRIKNTGRLNFRIDQVTFEVYRLPVLDRVEDLANGPVTSLTAAGRLRGVQPLHRETLPVSETVGVNNELQRSFSFVIRKEERSLYMITANAAGGLPVIDAQRDDAGRFGDRDLHHASELADICPSVAAPA